ncbi:MAG: S8 family serine peptidase [Nodosilinea sp.]
MTLVDQGRSRLAIGPIITLALASLLPLTPSVQAQSTSMGPQGIDALRLHQAPYRLTGRKIAIGQVEMGRPSQFGLDKIAYEEMPVAVRRVLRLTGWALPDEDVDGHAANVAGIMISRDKRYPGVAPEALLYSSAVGPTETISAQPEECLAAQAVALQNGGDVRAINFSFGEPLSRDPRPQPLLDGNALLTQCIDWSSRVHHTLYVIAGNQGRGGIPIPTDNFNGINVAYSRRVGGVFTEVDFANLGSEPTVRSPQSPGPEKDEGPRRSINLVAPGSQISLLDPDGLGQVGSGTSFAAPHVVGVIALLQELVDRQWRAGVANWSLGGRDPMVMKAVLLNSADKLQDTGDGLRLGMSRTLLDNHNQNWLDSDAYRDRAIPLHRDLGTGHLNAYRAYQQLVAGAFAPGPVPPMGWTLSQLAWDGSETVQDYLLTPPLKAGSYLSATLTWQRRVELVDSNGNGLYDRGESFADEGLNNLDLYLLPIDAEDIRDNIWSSESQVDSVEHIFYKIPQTGRYKLRVVYHQQSHNQPIQPYALAWWAVAAQP